MGKLSAKVIALIVALIVVALVIANFGLLSGWYKAQAQKWRGKAEVAEGQKAVAEGSVSVADQVNAILAARGDAKAANVIIHQGNANAIQQSPGADRLVDPDAYAAFDRGVRLYHSYDAGAGGNRLPQADPRQPAAAVPGGPPAGAGDRPE